MLAQSKSILSNRDWEQCEYGVLPIALPLFRTINVLQCMLPFGLNRALELADVARKLIPGYTWKKSLFDIVE